MGKFPETLWNMIDPIKYLELMKRLLRTWNIKIKVKNIGIKF